jgi:hypothetical protein
MQITKAQVKEEMEKILAMSDEDFAIWSDARSTFQGGVCDCMSIGYMDGEIRTLDDLKVVETTFIIFYDNKE